MSKKELVIKRENLKAQRGTQEGILLDITIRLFNKILRESNDLNINKFESYFNKYEEYEIKKNIIRFKDFYFEKKDNTLYYNDIDLKLDSSLSSLRMAEKLESCLKSLKKHFENEVLELEKKVKCIDSRINCINDLIEQF